MIAIVGAFLIAYFARPRQPHYEFVTPQQELPSYHARYPGDMTLANRVLKSYDLAFILVQSPYLSTNVTALESVREWARDQFQAHPDFLHPVSLADAPNNHDTVFGALAGNIFALPHNWIDGVIAGCMRKQIAHFHSSGAFHSFNKAFLDVFGSDADSAALLARYESDRARHAIDVVAWALVWLAGTIAGGAMLIVNRKTDFFRSLRFVTAGAWSLLALAYFAQSWNSGHAAALISAALACAFAIYLLRPILFLSHSEVKQQLVHIRLAPCWIAVAAWFTFTCLAVQILTWIRSGIPASPDPVSLLIAGISGNFIHDAVQEKHAISTVVACLWSLITVWAVLQRSKDQPYSEPDDSFATLDRAKELQPSG